MKSGLYIHVPICASRCIYCDFYSTTLRGVAEAYADAVIREAEAFPWRTAACLPGEIRTLYLGGGTPSQLGGRTLNRLLNRLSRIFDFSHVEEATLEVNPEDVDDRFAQELFEGGSIINRVSMGVQSFIDEELLFLRRRHNAAKPAEAIRILREHGIQNISIDLMYGLPYQTMDSWSRSIDAAIALKTQHISAYCLSVEENTPLDKMMQKEGDGLILPDEEMCIEMAEMLRSRLRAAGYLQYEISNYALPGYHSRHNSAYWDGTPYLGLGPGAHSYDGRSVRYWNNEDLHTYLNIDYQSGDTLWINPEHLSPANIRNERVMLGLRTRRGIPMELVQGYEETVAGFISRGLLVAENGRLRLTEPGLNLGDEVTRELFAIDDP